MRSRRRLMWTVAAASCLTLALLALTLGPLQAAGARSVTRTAVGSRVATIPAGSTAVFRWTVTRTPPVEVDARFQISADRRHWRTIRSFRIAATTTAVRTRWAAPKHAVTRFFRLTTPSTHSNVVKVRVR